MWGQERRLKPHGIHLIVTNRCSAFWGKPVLHLHPNCLEATIFIDAAEDVLSKGIALSSNTFVNELLKWPHQRL
jgi:hypothetical protein